MSKQKRVVFRCTDQQKKEIFKEAEENDRTVSNFMIKLWRDYKRFKGYEILHREMLELDKKVARKGIKTQKSGITEGV